MVIDKKTFSNSDLRVMFIDLFNSYREGGEDLSLLAVDSMAYFLCRFLSIEEQGTIDMVKEASISGIDAIQCDNLKNTPAVIEQLKRFIFGFETSYSLVLLVDVDRLLRVGAYNGTSVLHNDVINTTNINPKLIKPFHVNRAYRHLIKYAKTLSY